MTRLEQSRTSRLSPTRRRFPLVGFLTAVVGVIHLAITPLVFPRSVQSLLDGGLLGAVEADPAMSELRGLAFWYATSGLAFVAVGALIAAHEQRAGRPTILIPVSLAGLGIWGVLLMPESPFWVLIALAAVSVARRRVSHRP